MRGKADEERSPADGARFHRSSTDDVRRAARRVLRSRRATYSSQAAFRSAVLDLLHRDDPLASVGGTRLRRIAMDASGIRLVVRYTEHPGEPVGDTCPVCGSALKAILNQTLSGGRVALGRRCTRCAYWSHAARRVPVRYAFVNGSSIRSDRNSR